MAWFRRENPEEMEATSLEQYYADQHRSSALGWLLAAVTFFVTLILIFGVFWGGRWAWRKATNDDNKTTTTTATQTTAGSEEIVLPNGEVSGGASRAASDSRNLATTSNGSARASSTSSTSATTSNQIKTTTTSLPNSGPGNLIAVFIGSTIIGTIAHKAYAYRQIDR